MDEGLGTRGKYDRARPLAGCGVLEVKEDRGEKGFELIELIAFVFIIQATGLRAGPVGEG